MAMRDVDAPGRDRSEPEFEVDPQNSFESEDLVESVDLVGSDAIVLEVGHGKEQHVGCVAEMASSDEGPNLASGGAGPGQAELTDAATSLSGFHQHLSEIIFLGCDDRWEEDTELTLNDALGGLSHRCSTSVSESLVLPCERQTADAVIRSFHEQQKAALEKNSIVRDKTAGASGRAHASDCAFDVETEERF